MSIDWPLQSSVVQEADGPIRIMLRLSTRLFAFAVGAPLAALIASRLILIFIGGDTRITGPIGLTTYLAVSALIFGVGATIWTRRLRAQQCHEWVLGTAKSASEALILTDARGTITAMNGPAESMTGWAASDAIGQPIIAVFRLVDERTHRPVVNPLVKALYKKVVVGPSPNALLVGKEGMEWRVHERAAPIVDERGSVFAGAVAFRSTVTEAR